MPGQPFYFALQFSSHDVSVALLDDLAAQVLRHAGCRPHDVPDLDGALAMAATTAAGSRRCDVQFAIRDGALEIVVSSNGGRLFRASHPISDRP
ncbi:MAG: hypothetical protein GEU82_11805 [Luteitalea sp.]|nr:hypothetical protein [Luteitalea sp.]